MEAQDKVDQFRKDVARLDLPGSASTREKALARLGGALLVVGPAWAVVSYFISRAATGSLQQNDAMVSALVAVCITLAGVALFLRYSAAGFLRFWLARLSYEQQRNAAQIAEAVRPGA